MGAKKKILFFETEETGEDFRSRQANKGSRHAHVNMQIDASPVSSFSFYFK